MLKLKYLRGQLTTRIETASLNLLLRTAEFLVPDASVRYLPRTGHSEMNVSYVTRSNDIVGSVPELYALPSN